MTPSEPRPVPSVCDTVVLRGAAAARDAVPDLLIEVPHGATRAAHFDALRAELAGPFPADLRDYFFVNTDVGAPETALETARRVVAAAPARSVVVIRCLVPRTFIDCNRIVDASTRPSKSAAGQMTPGVTNYVTDAADLRLLLGRHAQYVEETARAFDAVCGAGGTALMLHSYAPKSVDVRVDERIVERLRAAYEPQAYANWPWRAEVDLITTPAGGATLADEALAARVEAGFRRDGLAVARNGAYSLHPSSMAWLHASRHPGRTLCLEMRRDLLVREFTPFAEMEPDPAKTGRMAAVLAAALAG
jgi:predicted N-formylglutamate amidohydrolase